MKKISFISLNEKIENVRGLQGLIRSTRNGRPTDNKPRTKEEKLILMENAYRKWNRDMVKTGERKWTYVGNKDARN